MLKAIETGIILLKYQVADDLVGLDLQKQIRKFLFCDLSFKNNLKWTPKPSTDFIGL